MKLQKVLEYTVGGLATISVKLLACLVDPSQSKPSLEPYAIGITQDIQVLALILY